MCEACLHSSKFRRAFTLIFLIVSYGCIGAAIIQGLEFESYHIRQDKYKEIRLDWQRSLNITESKFNELESSIISNFIELEDNLWSFENCFLFCVETLSTQGFGRLAPYTREGQIFTIIYAFFGIGLTTLFMINFGQTCMKLVKYLSKKEKNRRKRRRRQFLTILAAFVFTITSAALWYHMTEKWDYMESIYYAFIAFSTIGYGDIYPHHENLIRLVFTPFGIGIFLVLLSQVAQEEMRRLNRITSMALNVQIYDGLEFSKTFSEMTVPMMTSGHTPGDPTDTLRSAASINTDFHTSSHWGQTSSAAMWGHQPKRKGFFERAKDFLFRSQTSEELPESDNSYWNRNATPEMPAVSRSAYDYTGDSSTFANRYHTDAETSGGLDQTQSSRFKVVNKSDQIWLNKLGPNSRNDTMVSDTLDLDLQTNPQDVLPWNTL